MNTSHISAVWPHIATVIQLNFEKYYTENIS